MTLAATVGNFSDLEEPRRRSSTPGVSWCGGRRISDDDRVGAGGDDVLGRHLLAPGEVPDHAALDLVGAHDARVVEQNVGGLPDLLAPFGHYVGTGDPVLPSAQGVYL